jgi:hypothetical protein
MDRAGRLAHDRRAPSEGITTAEEQLSDERTWAIESAGGLG